MDFKNFKSASDKQIRIALTSGHVWLIGREWIKIPEFAWSACYAGGCISEDMFTNSVIKDIPEAVVKSLSTSAQHKDLIREVLLGWVENNRMDNFRNDGNPNMVRLSSDLPFTPQKGMVAEVWSKIQQESRET